ncbi:MAG: dihydrolipoyl dehydrogenase [Planctomycetota bacterium]
MAESFTPRGAEYDLVVLGAGPGGYVAAIRAAQNGMKVAVVERERPGGICLNWGCIPSKALLKSVEVLEHIRHSKDYGITITGKIEPDMKAIIARSRGVVDQIVKGVEYLIKKNKIEHVKGEGRLLKATTVSVKTDKGERVLEAKKVILATGGRARNLPGLEPNGKNIVSYREAMLVDRIPKHAVVIGGGAIGCEFAPFWAALGAKVTIVEMMPQILPVEDEEVSKFVAREMTKRGLAILTETAYKGTKVSGETVQVTVAAKDGKEQTLEADLVLGAIGVRGNVENLGLEDLKVEVVKSFVKVGKGFETAAKGLHAIGDVIGGALLAHKASFEGISCADWIAGKGTGTIAYDQIPGGTFCHPSVGSIGLTEKAAREKGHDVKVGKFPFKALGRAVAVGEPEGFVKIVSSAKRGEILGCHIVGAGATDLVNEVAVAMKAEATVHELHDAIHAHPTFPEAIMEAAGDALGHAIHL